MQEEKKSIFERFFKHTPEIMGLSYIAIMGAAIIIPIIAGCKEESYNRKNRMSNIKDLQESGADVNINLNGDI